ncbi:lipid II:glycine glycyltransferase FemX [Natrinema marinum]|uniref:lipid II:glycine glycyltransferase FemX n=1 Tax=Natrinema marinum TaxID=2961598 RepID=UPI0020C84346|nr:GNAT family N-acetyltransferase [Natrinema marinum]
MSIEITTLDGTVREQWDKYVSRSPHGTIFHRYAALKAQEDCSNTSLHPLVGYKGEEPIGVFPVFSAQRGPFTFAFSPPYELHVPNLGPALLNMQKLKQRKREKRHRRFIDGCLEWITTELETSYVSIRTGWRYDDLRPFTWNEFDVQPSYTYVIDLETDEDELLERFSSTTRKTVRNNLDEEYAVTTGGREAVEWIMERVRERYHHQEKTATISTGFVVDLYDRLPEGTVRPYILSVDGEPVTGTILLEDDGIAHRWQGGAKPDVDLPANELLEWHMLTDAMERGIREYEMVDANEPRINKWKAKFAPDVRTYFTMKRSGPGVEAAVQLYLRLRDQSELVTKLAPGR